MKAIVLICLIGLAGMGMAAADLKIPRDAYVFEDLEKAKVKAASDDLPLIFVLTNPRLK